MWKHCHCCNRAFEPGFDNLERLLQFGLPPQPKRQATKAELIKEIDRLRLLLDDIRTTLIRVYMSEARAMQGSNPEIRQL